MVIGMIALAEQLASFATDEQITPSQLCMRF